MRLPLHASHFMRPDPVMSAGAVTIAATSEKLGRQCATTAKECAAKRVLIPKRDGDACELATEGLAQAIEQVVGHHRAPAVVEALRKQDVVTDTWLLETTHAEAMELADASGLTRQEMLRLREVTANYRKKQLLAASDEVEDSVPTAAAPIQLSGFGLRSLLHLRCVGRSTPIKSPPAAAT